MRSFNLKHLGCILILWGNSSCVSIDLNKNKVKRSESVEFQEPQKPFESFSTENLDKAWKNPKNGNSISFLSDCSNQVDPSLVQIQAGVIQDIQNKKEISSQEKMFNKRAALHSIVGGKVDGIDSKIELLIFKKNNCIYILTYVALKRTFKPDQHYFQQFLKGFIAK